jgi:hypothetical protein
LEEKLDGLFTLLKASAQPTPRASPSANTIALSDLPEIVDDDRGALVDPQASFFPPPKRRNILSHSAGYPTPSDSSSNDYHPSFAEAEELLHFFRTQRLSLHGNAYICQHLPISTGIPVPMALHHGCCFQVNGTAGCSRKGPFSPFHALPHALPLARPRPSSLPLLVFSLALFLFTPCLNIC